MLQIDNSNRWSEEDKEYLRRNYRFDNIDNCAKHLNRSRQAVMKKASDMGLKSGRYLTKEQINMLHRLGRRSNQALSSYLGRNNVSTRRLRRQHDIGSIRDCRFDEYVLAEIGEMMGKSKSTISKVWVKKRGLKVERVGKRFVFVKEDDLIQFLQDNPKLWDATKCDDTLFHGYEWFEEKRKRDFNKMVEKRWGRVV